MRYVDPNAIMVMERIVFIWEDGEGRSTIRNELFNFYDDEYALYIAEDMLGQTWVDRQIPVVNVSCIMETCIEDYNKNSIRHLTGFLLKLCYRRSVMRCGICSMNAMRS